MDIIQDLINCAQKPFLHGVYPVGKVVHMAFHIKPFTLVEKSHLFLNITGQ